jgi:hypothetical protein
VAIWQAKKTISIVTEWCRCFHFDKFQNKEKLDLTCPKSLKIDLQRVSVYMLWTFNLLCRLKYLCNSYIWEKKRWEVSHWSKPSTELRWFLESYLSEQFLHSSTSRTRIIYHYSMVIPWYKHKQNRESEDIQFTIVSDNTLAICTAINRSQFRHSYTFPTQN